MPTGPYELHHRQFGGTSRQIGAAYGEAFAAAIQGFYRQEVAVRLPRGGRQPLVAAARRMAGRWTPQAATILGGIADGSGLTGDQALQLALHEELVHTKHCTAVVGPHLVAQNWDWCPSLYAWPGVVTLKPSRGRATLTYHYPGLWACCGVNDDGLALMWTGSAYYPPVPPRAGVPTYLLIAELLQQKDVAGALGFLAKAPRAGSFIFLIADARGDAAVIEATPQTFVFSPVETAAARANHFVETELVRASRQKLPTDRVYNTGARYAAACNALDDRRLSSARARQLLLTPPIYRREKTSYTLDSLIADCKKRTLTVRRGDGQRWRTFSL